MSPLRNLTNAQYFCVEIQPRGNEKKGSEVLSQFKANVTFLHGIVLILSVSVKGQMRGNVCKICVNKPFF